MRGAQGPWSLPGRPVHIHNWVNVRTPINDWHGGVAGSLCPTLHSPGTILTPSVLPLVVLVAQALHDWHRSVEGGLCPTLHNPATVPHLVLVVPTLSMIGV